MLKTTKVNLLTIIFLSIGLIVPVLINLFFAKQLLAFTKISYLFVIPCIYILFSCFGSKKVGGHAAKIRYGFLKWFLLIAGTEIGFASLFIIQNKIILMSNYLHFSKLDLLSNSLTMMGLNWGLFPWAFLGVLGISFSLLIQKDQYAPYSALFPAWPDQFWSDKLKVGLNTYISLSTKLFLSINAIFIAILLYSLINPQGDVLNPLNGIIVTTLLFLLYAHKLSDYFQSINYEKIPQGIYYIIFIVITAALLFISNFVARVISAKFQSLHSEHAVLDVLLLNNKKIWITLWFWSWWILAAPLFSSLVVKFSHGRSARGFLAAILFLPVVFLSILFSIEKYNIHLIQNILSYLWLFYIPLFFGALFLVVILFNKISNDFLWFGFIPFESPKKKRYAMQEQLWILTISLTGVFFITYFTCIQLFTILFTLPCLLIYLLSLGIYFNLVTSCVNSN